MLISPSQTYVIGSGILLLILILIIIIIHASTIHRLWWAQILHCQFEARKQASLVVLKA